jgi:hypothetical protein
MRCWFYYVRWIGFIIAAGCILAAMCKKPPSSKQKAWIIALWAILPPLWFLLEFALYQMPTGPNDGLKFERFKYGQDLASRVWGAIALLLAGLYFGPQLAVPMTKDHEHAEESIRESASPRSQNEISLDGQFGMFCSTRSPHYGDAIRF